MGSTWKEIAKKKKKEGRGVYKKKKENES